MWTDPAAAEGDYRLPVLLAINAGSSSLKFGLFQAPDCSRIARGQIEDLADQARLKVRVGEEAQALDLQCSLTQEQALNRILEWISERRVRIVAPVAGSLFHNLPVHSGMLDPLSQKSLKRVRCQFAVGHLRGHLNQMICRFRRGGLVAHGSLFWKRRKVHPSIRNFGTNLFSGLFTNGAGPVGIRLTESAGPSTFPFRRRPSCPSSGAFRRPC